MSHASRSTRRRSLIWIGAVLLGLVGAALLWKLAPMEEALRWLMNASDGLGWRGPMAFAGIYTLLLMIGFPATPLNVTAGILFGYWLALGTTLAAALTSASAAFFLGRSLLQERFQRRLKSTPALARILEKLQSECFKVMLLARLNPLVPGTLKSYGFGAMEVPFGKYLASAAIGQSVIFSIHVYLGWAGGYAAIQREQPPTTLEIGLLVGGIVVSVVLIAITYIFGRRALDDGN